MSNEWVYIGDIDPYRGGKWIKVHSKYKRDFWADLVEVTDLESATGADGLIMIEYKTVYGFTEKDKVRSALSSCGMKLADLRSKGKDTILLFLADALSNYGYTDPANRWPKHHIEVLVTQSYDGDRASWNGWEHNLSVENSVKLHKVYNDDLDAYVNAEWLD